MSLMGPFTVAVAEDASSGKTLGFVIGYRPPTHPDAYFCWQVGVTQDARGKRIARRMLEQLCKSQAESHGVKYLEATVTGDNQASQNLFRSIGRRAGCEVAVTKAHFPERVFPKGHLAEDLFRVGPFESDTIGTVVEDKEAARS
jgi:L-2,4-diaminobutyric acid acetyltransferase